MVKRPASGTEHAIATRIVFTRTVRSVNGSFAGLDTGAMANCPVAAAREEADEARLGGADAREGPLGDEETGDDIGAGRDDLRAGGGSDLSGGGGRRDDLRAGGGREDKLAGSRAGHGGSFVGGGRGKPRSRTSDDGDDGVEASHGVGALRFVNPAIAWRNATARSCWPT